MSLNYTKKQNIFTLSILYPLKNRYYLITKTTTIIRSLIKLFRNQNRIFLRKLFDFNVTRSTI